MRTAIVIDDHPVTHLGCRPLLEEAGFDLVLEARGSDDGYRLCSQHLPDLIILDLGLPGVGGLAMIPRLAARAPAARILVFSMHDDPIFAARALEAGAHGYVTKMARPDELMAAIRATGASQIYVEHKIATRLAVLHAGRGASPLANLTARELQILHLIGSGKRHGDIAEELHLSYKTVANTCSLLKSKLGARTLADLVRIAIENPSAAAIDILHAGDG
jgi:DNA-binding NarL/FixJ family response regulator